MEYCENQSIQYYIDKVVNNEKFTKQESSHWDYTHKLIMVLGISFGMEYLHSQNIIHRDLKPGNVLLDSNFYPKICDFGLAKILSNSLTMTSKVGTPLFSAPEQLSSSNYDGKKADCYSFGMTMYSIFHDEPPFSESLNIETEIQLYERLMKGERPKIDQGKVSKFIKQLITRCWDNDPKIRPSFADISRELLKESERLCQKRAISMKEIKIFVNDVCKRDFSFNLINQQPFKDNLRNHFKCKYKSDKDYKNGFSSLHYAAKNNLKEIGKLLISEEDVNGRDK